MACEPLLARHAPQVGDHRAREIECLVRAAEHDFRRIGIFQCVESVGLGEGFDERGDVGRRIVEAAGDRLQLRGGDEGFVALYVDDDVGVAAQFVDGFPTAVGAAAVIGRGHDGTAAEGLHRIVDARIVGGDGCVGEHLRHLLPDMPDDRFAAEPCQRFARKPCRSVTGRNDGQKFQRVHIR